MTADEPASTFPKLFAEVVAERGPHDAVVTARETLSYDELERRTARLARAFLAAGAGKGARIALLAPDGIPWITTFLASLRIGALVTAISTLSTPRELAHILRNSDTQLFVGARRFLNHDYVETLTRGLPRPGGRARAGSLRPLRRTLPALDLARRRRGAGLGAAPRRAGREGGRARGAGRGAAGPGGGGGRAQRRRGDRLHLGEHCPAEGRGPHPVDHRPAPAGAGQALPLEAGAPHVPPPPRLLARRDGHGSGGAERRGGPGLLRDAGALRRARHHRAARGEPGQQLGRAAGAAARGSDGAGHRPWTPSSAWATSATPAAS